jgi:hypothetical protein
MPTTFFFHLRSHFLFFVLNVVSLSPTTNLYSDEGRRRQCIRVHLNKKGGRNIVKRLVFVNSPFPYGGDGNRKFSRYNSLPTRTEIILVKKMIEGKQGSGFTEKVLTIPFDIVQINNRELVTPIQSCNISRV